MFVENIYHLQKEILKSIYYIGKNSREKNVFSSLCLAEMYDKSTLTFFAYFSLPPKAQSYGAK